MVKKDSLNPDTTTNEEIEKYGRIIHRSQEDNKYIVEVPALDGCIGVGDTVGEAMDNADKAICRWIELAKGIGRAIPDADDMGCWKF